MKWYIVLALAIIGYWYTTPQRVTVVTQAATQPTQATAQPQQVAPVAGNYRQQFALDLAHALGNTQPSEATMLFIEAWANAENMPASAHNPLATTMPMPNSTCHNWLCVRIYDSDATGVQATVETLQGKYAGYSEIVAGIRANNPQRALLGLAASPWGTSASLTMQVYNEAIASRAMSLSVSDSKKIAYTPADNEAPHGSPFKHNNVVLKQGYGIGSHAPAATWGGIDLAITGTPSATEGATIYAIMGGIVRTSTTMPCGNGLEITHNGYRVLYCHLQGFLVQNGATVRYGDPVALAGHTGAASGPHLHLEVWKDGKNLNPIPFVSK